MRDDWGEMALPESNPEEFKVLCQAKGCGPTWANPVLANGKLHIRDEKGLICLQVGE